SEPVAFGAAFSARSTVNSPQFVSNTRRYVFPGSSFRCSFDSVRSCVWVVACEQPPFFAACSVAPPLPPPQPASTRTSRSGTAPFTTGDSTGVERQPIRYAKSGDVNIAFQITGDGPIDLVLVHGFYSHLELDWDHPASRHITERLSSFARLIRFDKRGTGLSDRSVGLPDFETRMDDVRAVMDAAGSERAALF